jgi:Amidohydrolase family
LNFASIEHAWALIPHFSNNKKYFDKDIANKIHELSTQDSSKTADILSKIAQKNIYYVPTHVTSNRKEYLAFDKNFRTHPNNQYVESTQLFFWNVLNWLHIKGYDEVTDKPILENYYKRGLEVTQLAQKNGVKILAGTDALDRNVYYGFSLHDELKELVKAGLTNAEALKTATINATDYYGISDKYGAIGKGKFADFIILEANPLVNIDNTQAIHSVYYNFRLYEKNDLQEMKNFVKEQAKSFGINCKFTWNMIKSIF